MEIDPFLLSLSHLLKIIHNSYSSKTKKKTSQNGELVIYTVFIAKENYSVSDSEVNSMYRFGVRLVMGTISGEASSGFRGVE